MKNELLPIWTSIGYVFVFKVLHLPIHFDVCLDYRPLSEHKTSVDHSQEGPDK